MHLTSSLSMRLRRCCPFGILADMAIVLARKCLCGRDGRRWLRRRSVEKKFKNIRLAKRGRKADVKALAELKA